MNDRPPDDLRVDLASIYEEVMWLSNRPNVTASRARAWYTHVMAESVKRRVRQFSGLVSVEAISSQGGNLRLEHHKRIQTTLTALVDRHRREQRHNPDEFVRTVIECESVHIVTSEENYAAMRARGDYELAGIALMPWDYIPAHRRHELWDTMLRGRVANATTFKVAQGRQILENGPEAAKGTDDD